MTRATRRGVLGGLAALSAPLPALAAPSPDAELIRACARYLHLEAAIEGRTGPEALLDVDQTSYWPEYCSTQDLVIEAESQTPEGMAAMARVALLCFEGQAPGFWDDDGTQRIAFTLLAKLAGDEAVKEYEARCEGLLLRREASAAARAARPVPEIQEPTPAEKIERTRRAIPTLERALSAMKAEVAAWEAPA
ncbi:hypothetical protein J8J14_18145 [Roseomonas sp. SSH11]|uniref:Secreted protein n=1 Tax=Pararoseomonas baculiformis TaxID=2820812 RepID=A0ABS4AI83_9PROT|nr:hypothetical protein [Pararoseomonas baculiformis]MBP0446701.1 hypothetical protein [Pararoseomonas baculiformis]